MVEAGSNGSAKIKGISFFRVLVWEILELFSIRIIQAEPFLLVQCLKFSVLVEIFGIDVVNIENHVLSFLLV